MSRRLRLLPLLALAVAGSAAAQPSAPTRGEAPIREVVLSDGARRYAVPLQVDGAEVEAGLDTGSTGLRLLPGAVPGAAASGRRAETYAYSSGVKLEGVLGRPRLAIGALQGPASVEFVQSVGCVAQKPRCPASRIPPSAYGLQGDGLPGEGFKAILGANMGQADAENPFEALGARRWIVELPRPGEAKPGRLILNPTDAELEGFVYVPVLSAFRDQHGGLHDAVAGCLAKADGSARACGALMLDSGAPGIALRNGGLGPTAWPEGTRALILFHDGHSVVAGEALTVGLRAHASHLAFDTAPGPSGAVIFAGLSPYFAFSVLYDAEHQRIGLKPRPTAAGGPEGALTGPAAPDLRK